MTAHHAAIDALGTGEAGADAGRGEADLVAALARARRSHRLAAGARERCELAARAVLAFLFPHFAPASAGAPRCGEAAVLDELAGLRGVLRDAMLALPAEAVPHRAGDAAEGVELVVDALLARLPALYSALLLDARALLDGDPAARSLDEVLLAYPGFRAVAYYRVAHALDGEGEALARSGHHWDSSNSEEETGSCVPIRYSASSATRRTSG